MALASLMLWPSTAPAKNFTANGRTYTHAKLIHVLAADVAAAVSAGLVTIGTSGATPQAGNPPSPAAGAISSNPNLPPGGNVGVPNALPGGDPNRPTPAAAGAGGFHYDAALQKLVISDGSNWFDPGSGSQA